MTIRILKLNDVIEATKIKEILDNNEITHIIRSYEDTAYDGLFQHQHGGEYLRQMKYMRKKFWIELSLAQKKHSSCFCEMIDRKREEGSKRNKTVFSNYKQLKFKT